MGSNLQDQINTLRKQLRGLLDGFNAAINGLVVGGVAVVQEVTAVTATTTNITTTFVPTVGALLFVIVTEDGTGGGQITWDSIFRYAPVNIGVSANDVNIFLFFGRTDPADFTVKWFLATAPIVGQR